MRVIPVLDVRGGRAVHARGGDRAHYAPIRSVLHPGSDPLALARAFRDRLGLEEIYLADLGAILGGDPPDLPLFRELAGLGLATWIDAGVRSAADLPALLDSRVDRVIVGLESVGGPGDLAAIVALAGADRVAFSLDLRDGRPLVDTRATWGTDDPDAIARRAFDAGVRSLIRLDLARVGTGRGVGIYDRDDDLPGSSGSSAAAWPGRRTSRRWRLRGSRPCWSARPCTTGGSGRTNWRGGVEPGPRSLRASLPIPGRL